MERRSAAVRKRSSTYFHTQVIQKSSERRALFPSPLAGEGGSRGAIASAIRERGFASKNVLTKITPLPTSLGFASARSPSPARGEGKRVCRASVSSNSESESQRPSRRG